MDFNGFPWQVWFDIGCEGIEVARLHVKTCALWHCSKNVKHISSYFMIFHDILAHLFFWSLLNLCLSCCDNQCCSWHFSVTSKGWSEADAEHCDHRLVRNDSGRCPWRISAMLPWRRGDVVRCLHGRLGRWGRLLCGPGGEIFEKFQEFPHPPDFSKRIESMTKWHHYPV